MKKLIAALCCFAMLIPSAMPVAVTAEIIPTEFKYELADDHAEITGCTSYEKELVFPEEIEGLPVTVIRGSFDISNAHSIVLPASLEKITGSPFLLNRKIEKISIDPSNEYFKIDEDGVLLSKDGTRLVYYPSGRTAAEYTTPAGVTTIGEFAFTFAQNLESLTVSEEVTAIKRNAFSCCGAAHISILGTVEEIPEHCFADCGNLVDIRLPEGIKKIGDHAFDFCTGLKSVTIPDGVEEIGYEAFDHTIKLETIVIPASVTKFGNDDDGSTIFLRCGGKPKHVTVYGRSGSAAEEYFSEFPAYESDDIDDFGFITFVPIDRILWYYVEQAI